MQKVTTCTCRDRPGKCTQTRQERKHKKTTILQKNHGKKNYMYTTTLHVQYFGCLTQLYATDIEQSCFYSSQFFCRRVVFLCFHSCFVSVLFTGPSLLVVNFYTNFYPLFLMFFCHLTANSLQYASMCILAKLINKYIRKKATA